MEGPKVLCELDLEQLRNKTDQIYFKCPEIRGIYTTDGVIFASKPTLRYFKEPRSSLYPLDLNRGFWRYKYRHENYYKSFLLVIEHYVMNVGLKVLASELTTVLTERRDLHLIMLLPYYSRRVITLATKFNGNFYISTRFHREKHPDLRNTYAFKFRQYCLVDSVNKEPDLNVPIDESCQTVSVYRCQLERFNIVYSAEEQGVIADADIKDLSDLEELNQQRFVLTKLLKPLDSIRHRKMLVSWAQAYLSKVDELYLGRIRDGYVDSPGQHISVEELATKIDVNANVCLNYLNEYLTMVQNVMETVDCPYTVYEFRYQPHSKEIAYMVHKGKTESSFLTDNFIEYVQGNQIP